MRLYFRLTLKAFPLFPFFSLQRSFAGHESRYKQPFSFALIVIMDLHKCVRVVKKEKYFWGTFGRKGFLIHKQKYWSSHDFS